MENLNREENTSLEEEKKNSLNKVNSLVDFMQDNYAIDSFAVGGSFLSDSGISLQYGGYEGKDFGHVSFVIDINSKEISKKQLGDTMDKFSDSFKKENIIKAIATCGEAGTQETIEGTEIKTVINFNLKNNEIIVHNIGPNSLINISLEGEIKSKVEAMLDHLFKKSNDKTYTIQNFDDYNNDDNH